MNDLNYDGAQSYVPSWKIMLRILEVHIVVFSFIGIIVMKRLYFPVIISHPWQDSTTSSKKDKDTTVVLAGSYNPPHYGHFTMLLYLAERYGEVVAVIGFNKKKKYGVSPSQRASILQQMVDDYKKKHDDFMGKIRVVVVDYYIWRFAKKINATIMFRGIRSWERDGKEERSLYLLNTWGPVICGPFYWPLPTYFLEGDPKYNHISSTFIRDLCQQEDDSKREMLSSLVPHIAVPQIVEQYCS